MLLPTKLGADDVEDMVVIRLGDARPCIPYQVALELAHYLRMQCKRAARYDHAIGSFWTDVPMEDLYDRPKAYHGFRRSKQVSNVDKWKLSENAQLIGLHFDGVGLEMDYETGIKLHQCIRRAGQRAKAWAGDSTKSSRMLANLTDAAEDSRQGLD